MDITVTAVTDATTDGDETPSTSEETQLTGNLFENLTDADSSDHSITGFTINGTNYAPGSTATLTEGNITVNANGTFTFDPAPDFNGAVPQVGYALVDDHDTADTDTSTLDITVTAVNDAPVATDDIGAASEDTTLTVNAASGVLSNDSDVDAGDTLSVTTFTDGTTTKNAGETLNLTEGDLTLNADGSYTFVPAANYNGPVPQVAYTVSDGNGGTDTAHLDITVGAVNDAPVATDDTGAASEDTTLTVNAAAGVLSNDSDSDGDTLSVTTFTDGTTTKNAGETLNLTEGDLTLNADGSYTFVPAANYNGPVPQVAYTVSDGNGGTDTAHLDITVGAVNDAPVATDDIGSTTQDTPVNIDVIPNDTDLDGDTLNVKAGSLTDPAHGTVSINPDGTIKYTPDANYNGADTFDYIVEDGHGGEATATVAIQVGLDTDNDGIPDSVDIDDDNDGIPDVVEENGAPGRDTDGDGIVDSLDLDSDNDGILDIEEANGVDANHDGMVDDATDTDNDGLADVADAAPAVADAPATVAEGLSATSLPVSDTDGDGKKDFQDTDSDNDGISDLVEAGIDPATNDTNNDGMLDTAPDADADGTAEGINPNGIAAVVDPATGTPVVTPDTDGDNVDNYRDLDSDNDGLNDVVEADPDADVDGNGLIDTEGALIDPSAIPDKDHDGVLDPLEPNNPNLGDLDLNGDGMIDNTQDADNDGIPDIVDLNTDGFGDNPISIRAVFWNDSDGDGVRDPDEDPIVGATVELLDIDGNPVSCPQEAKRLRLAGSDTSGYCTTTTDENGTYTFDNVLPAEYQVRFTLPKEMQADGFEFSTVGERNTGTITVPVDTTHGGMNVVMAEAAVNCGCGDITSDSADALGVFGMLMMMLGTVAAGLLFIRREELSI